MSPGLLVNAAMSPQAAECSLKAAHVVKLLKMFLHVEPLCFSIWFLSEAASPDGRVCGTSSLQMKLLSSEELEEAEGAPGDGMKRKTNEIQTCKKTKCDRELRGGSRRGSLPP